MLSFLSQLEDMTTMAFCVGDVIAVVNLHWSATVIPPALAKLKLPDPSVCKTLPALGAVLGNGCTSGHGVCGISRLSTRSIIATGTFMMTSFITVLLLLHF